MVICEKFWSTLLTIPLALGRSPDNPSDPPAMSLFQLPGLLGVLALPDFAFLGAAGLVALGLLAVPGLLADSHLLVTQRVCPR